MSQLSKGFSKFATLVARATERPLTFVLCVVLIFVWAFTGPLFHYSDTWQLVINTGTTIVTFLQVFLIQNTQNRDGAAIQAKLDELLKTSAAQSRFIGVEDLTEEELEKLRESDEGSRAERQERAQAAADQVVEKAEEQATKAALTAKPAIT